MTDLPERLRAIADSLEGDQWEHPITAVEDCLAAAAEIERLRDVAGWAQAVLTALNTGSVVESGSPLHLKLRDVMIGYREAARPLRREG